MKDAVVLGTVMMNLMMLSGVAPTLGYASYLNMPTQG